MKSLRNRYLLAGSLVAALLATTVVSPPAHLDLWAQAVFDWLHVPVFGLIAGSAFLITPSKWDWRYRLLAAATAALILGLLTEAAQTLLPSRSASAHDVLNDLVGAAACLGLITSFAPGLPVSRHLRILLILISAGLVGWSLSQPAKIFMAYAERYRQVPSIAPMQSRSSRLFFDLRNTTVRYISAPEGSEVVPEFLFGMEDAASINFHDPWPDWSRYTFLVLEFDNPGDVAISANLRIHDRAHLDGDQPGSDRFRTRLTVPPGSHALRLALDDIERAPSIRARGASTGPPRW